MPVSADALRKLADLRLAPDAMAVVLGIIADVSAPDDARRAKDAERKRSKRVSADNPRTIRGNSAENPRTEPESAETPRVSSTYLEVPEEPPQKENPIGGFPKSSPIPRPKARGTRLGADWTASTADLDYGRNLGVPEPILLREAEKFRDFWIAKAGPNGVKLDWPATWRNWIRRVADDRGFAPVQSQSGLRDQPGGALKIEPDTPQWQAWLDHRRRLGERTAFMEAEAKAGRGYLVPSEWPPALLGPSQPA